ncbi:hypothetical protein BpJC7_07920 [Weizmannia acidilactici]|uniref:Lipoprotein n=1 Tax=Weizmannia acidilactici TaxID=2607726 RepID=A0A5J4JDT8_9BACI|nr:hypothetical protein [Weizmannia acidilactici]GER66365.1 hypothetical protein BpJC4_08360 [Weizmannia acidilactici]GER69489.1 hypothetical protein BpJC7_07920 [Weizmannia acidilactici]GER73026.1 hypothetical protein BpPP18_10930 [Weizmannia acidilactici]
MAKRLICLFLIASLAGCFEESRDDAKPHPIETRQLSTTEKGGHVNQNDDRSSVTADIQKAKEAVWKMNGYIPHSVFINGKDMWVNVHTEYTLNHRERMEKESEIRDRLLKILPRYDIHVKIDVK